jgi:primosomal protein N' (replication factor Y)
MDSGRAAAADGVYVRVAVERGIDRGDGGAGEGLTYAVPVGMVRVGQRVEVPLGRGNKPAAGIVVEVGGSELLEGLSRAKPLLRASSAVLPETLVELARWMAKYYICPLGMVMAAMLPAAVKRGVGLRVRVELERAAGEDVAVMLESPRLSKAARKAWEAIGGLDSRGPWEPRALAREIGATNLGPVNRLVELGLLRKVEREVVRARPPVWERFELERPAPEPELTGEQRRAADGIAAGLGSFSVHLLRGVTGSGKTEVYMQVIRRVLGRGGSALVLVPEISLTPQTAGRFIERFKAHGAVAVLHSGLPAAERHRQWAVAASGKAAVVVGARSAVFAPVPRLGVIVVDEEHAGDYKQDQLPRYHGRDVAVKRGQLEGCPVVLGSATPSLESWANATARPARYALWELTERVGGGTLPRVEVVDLAAERRVRAELWKGGGRDARPTSRHDGGRPPSRAWDYRYFEALGPTLERALGETIAAGGQAILLLNRRGYSSYICCSAPSCGWVMNCSDCDAAMVLHRHGALPAGELLRCHHCLAEQIVPAQCPVCRRRVISMGVGTQRLEEELTAKFPPLAEGGAMVRVDGDTMKSARDYFDVLARFGRGEVRVLLGTQMISKGLDFPNVRLVGVINADTGLSLPDFRAAERTFQLVSQVAGRAGRGGHAGRVIVQTVNPHAQAIRLAAAHDYVSFAREELELRRGAGLPPVTRMARIVVRDEDHARALSRARALAEELERAGGGRLRLLGPGPCPVSRIAGQFRMGIEVLARRTRDLQAALNDLRERGLLKSDAATAVDVDPVALI